MVKAGESGGFLETILSRLAQYLESSKEIKDQIVSVMIYPLILMIVSGALHHHPGHLCDSKVCHDLLRYGTGDPSADPDHPHLQPIRQGYWWAGVGMIALIYFGLKMYTQDEERRWQWDRFKLRWVVIGDLIKKIEVARFARTLGTLLQSGVSILPAFNLVKEISQNQAISRSISHVHDRLREGKGISKSLEETAIFPPLAIHMIGVGEETGRLDEMLIKVAESYEENVRTAVKRFVSLLEPMILLIMGGVVGFIVLSILLAITSITEILLAHFK